MNFQWISTIPWSDIKDLRGSTSVEPLARLRCALQQAQHVILRAILHHGSSSRGSQPAWKVVLLSSSWAVQPRTHQTAIGPVSWKHDWTSSGLRNGQRLRTMVRAECDATTITQASSEGQSRTNRRSQDSQCVRPGPSLRTRSRPGCRTQRRAGPGHQRDRLENHKPPLHRPRPSTSHHPDLTYFHRPDR